MQAIRYVYKIFRPETLEVIYIGSSSNPAGRFYTITKGLPDRHKLRLEILGEFDRWEALAEERKQIRIHKDQGQPLMNKYIMRPEMPKKFKHAITRKRL